MSSAKTGYLLIADITGYTVFLSTSELEHAQETLSTLLKLLIEHTRPPLVISRLAGDAVISYLLQERFLQGQTFVEMIEDTYVAFRRAIELMVLNNTCRCNACANVPTLDLKFFVHYGTFGLQRLGTHDELIGNDVNLIHRLLKNHVTEKTGLRGYALYTEAAVQNLGLTDWPASLSPMSEAYDHLGTVPVWIQDLRPVWQEKRERTRVPFPPEQILQQVSTEIEMSPEQVWDYLANPDFRTILIGSDRQEIIRRKGGRLAPGSAFQCFHGDRIHLHTILDWVPFERVLTEDTPDLPVRSPRVLSEYRLEPAEHGTRLTQSVGRATGPLIGRVLINTVLRLSTRAFQRDIDAFKARIEADLAEQGENRELTPEITQEEIERAARAGLAESRTDSGETRTSVRPDGEPAPDDHTS